MEHIKKYWLGYALLVIAVIALIMNWNKLFGESTPDGSNSSPRRSNRSSVQREKDDVCYYVCANGKKCKGKWHDGDCYVAGGCIIESCGPGSN